MAWLTCSHIQASGVFPIRVARIIVSLHIHRNTETPNWEILLQAREEESKAAGALPLSCHTRRRGVGLLSLLFCAVALNSVGHWQFLRPELALEECLAALFSHFSFQWVMLTTGSMAIFMSNVAKAQGESFHSCYDLLQNYNFGNEASITGKASL